MQNKDASMTAIPLRKLSPADELAYLKEIHGNDYSKIFAVIIGHFDVLQSRAQMLLGLVAICLTITGFSGPQIARSSLNAKICLTFGLFGVLAAAIILVLGPLQLRWGTQRRAATVDESLIAQIAHRNKRTTKYHVASVVLVIGLAGYMGSLLAYMLML